MLSAEEVDWISSEDFKEMKSLGIDNPKEYFKQKENKVTDKNVESILLESVGNRTLIHHHFKGVRTHFEKLLGSKILDGEDIGGWEYQPNGTFQHCMAEDPFVIHADDQQWAAMVYLTPDAPPECGTSMYRHKDSGRDAIRDGDWDVFKGNFYDATPFELVDKIGNKYNRCVIMDARLIHAASEYFGDNIKNDRLFQIYFFNTEEQK